VGGGLEAGALITGAHSGLANLSAVPPRGENPQLAAQEIRFLGCDASRLIRRAGRSRRSAGAGRLAFSVGRALAVPRYPTALAYGASTPLQALDHAGRLGLSDALS
jgi:hypothetical protein